MRSRCVRRVSTSASSMPKGPRDVAWPRLPSASGEQSSDMTHAVQTVPWPEVKRSLVAILRGIRPDEAEIIVEGLIDNGFELIEVPLNSPDPFVSIERLCKRFGGQFMIGAGMVLTVVYCACVADVGGCLMVSRNGVIDL